MRPVDPGRRRDIVIERRLEFITRPALAETAEHTAGKHPHKVEQGIVDFHQRRLLGFGRLLRLTKPDLRRFMDGVLFATRAALVAGPNRLMAQKPVLAVTFDGTPDAKDASRIARGWKRLQTGRAEAERT
jgi:hypothetical protein